MDETNPKPGIESKGVTPMWCILLVPNKKDSSVCSSALPSGKQTLLDKYTPFSLHFRNQNNHNGLLLVL